MNVVSAKSITEGIVPEIGATVPVKLLSLVKSSVQVGVLQCRSNWFLTGSKTGGCRLMQETSNEAGCVANVQRKKKKQTKSV